MEEIPEPQPEMLDPPFDIKQFSCQRTKCHGKNKKHGPTGSYAAVFDRQHVGERAGNTDKQNGNAASFHENILYIFPQALFEKKPRSPPAMTARVLMIVPSPNIEVLLCI